MNVIARTTLVLCLCAIAATAQKPAFDAASVKVAESGGPAGDIAVNMADSPGHFTMLRRPMRFIVQWAYDLKDYELQGPGWFLGDERYDIVATAPGATQDQMRVMLQNLIADRFRMTSHFETKDMQVYVLARGKGEPKLKPSEGDPPLGPPTGTTPRPGVAFFNHQPISRFTFMLTRRLDRPVLDETGLKGTFDFAIDLSGLGFNGRMPENPDAPSIFSTVQSDLGLKLDSAKRPIKILVVDSANKVPTAN